MRMKGKSWLAFCVLFLVYFTGNSSRVSAQESICVFPSGTGVVNELASSLTIYPSNELIDTGSQVYLRAAWGCYPFQYSWTVQGTGYSLSKATTNGDLDYTVLTVVSGTCGPQADYDPYVTVTVTDSCEGVQSIVIRDSEETWNGIMGCGGPCGENCGPWQEIVVGQCRWVFRCCTPYWNGLAWDCPIGSCGPPGDIPGSCADELGELLRTEACPGECAVGTHTCLNVASAQYWGCSE